MKICGIYKITSPSKRVYIGQSSDILKRWMKHRCSVKYKYKKSKLRSSFISHGFENHKFDILCQCDKEELNRLEEYYVDLFQSFDNKNGLNLRAGGGSKTSMSKESIEKIRQNTLNNPTRYWKGKKFSEEHKRKLSEARKKQKPSYGMLGKKSSKETKELLSRIVKKRIEEGKFNYFKSKIV